MKFQLVDGTGDDKKAPRPRRGLVRVLYDTIEALDGKASVADIKKYMPAAIMNSQDVIKPRQLQKGLYNGTYNGYFLHSENKKYYSIAPYSHYKNRQDFILAPKEKKRTAFEKTVSLPEAAKLVDMARGSLYRKARNGELATIVRGDGTKGVEISELERVFGYNSKPAKQEPTQETKRDWPLIATASTAAFAVGVILGFVLGQ